MGSNSRSLFTFDKSFSSSDFLTREKNAILSNKKQGYKSLRTDDYELDLDEESSDTQSDR